MSQFVRDAANETVIHSVVDYHNFLRKHLRDYIGNGRGGRPSSDSEFRMSVTRTFGYPPIYPCYVWSWIDPPACEIGPTFPQPQVRWETLAELKNRVRELGV